MSEPALIIDGVSKNYGKFTALNNTSISVNKGEVLALLGHNGAGKTTLFKLALGLINPSSGKISLMCDKNNIGYLPENIAFYDQMSGQETLSYYAKLKKAPLTQVDELLEIVGLAPFKNRRIRAYSKGMKQRLGFAQALLGSPEILFLDEPMTGLDPIGREEFFDIIKQLKDKGTAIIFSSHVLRELENKVDNIAIMHSGNLIAYDSLDALRAKAAMPDHIYLKLKNSTQQKEWEKYLSSFTGKELHIVRQGDKELSISYPFKMKQTLVKHIMEASLPFEDINIVPPSLADIYVKMCQKQNDIVQNNTVNEQKAAA